MPLSPTGPHPLDVKVRAALAGATASMSPQSALLAWLDWLSHLAVSPGRQTELSTLALQQAEALIDYAHACAAAIAAGQTPEQIEPPRRDRRFAASEWRQWPFNLWHQAFLLNQNWWEQATDGIWGMSRHHQHLVGFSARQWLDLFSPGNHLATNPVALRRTGEQGGANLLRGLAYWSEDLARTLSGTQAPSDAFVVGRDVATTPGKVVLRNDLVELIQYLPTTATVRPEPVLVVPAWIMKYYILDLSPHNSLVRYLLDQGYTVFCVSWKNPGEAERDLGMDDYLQLGVAAVLDAIGAIVPQQRVHAAGYCLGGTLLAIAAAAMARDGDARLASLSLFTAQTDFSEPGELSLFIDDSQIALLEAQMAETGYLRGDQMTGAFQMLRSYDLLWSRLVDEYLLGERRGLNDLMAWNADTTRMPARMHSQYLRRLFLDDDLSEGRYPVGGRPVSLTDLTLPLFAVGTEADHVAPWRSVYKLHQLTAAEITFVLASGGHNAGIVSEPGHRHRSYRLHTRRAGEISVDAQTWLDQIEASAGSWWVPWSDWLGAHSGAAVAPPGIGAPKRGVTVLDDAPGQYVRER